MYTSGNRDFLLVTLASINYRRNVRAALDTSTHQALDSVQEDMMDYYDHHDERERKQMQHSSWSMRIYRAGPDEECGGDAKDEDGNAELVVANYYHNVILV